MSILDTILNTTLDYIIPWHKYEKIRDDYSMNKKKSNGDPYNI